MADICQINKEQDDNKMTTNEHVSKTKQDLKKEGGCK